MLVAHYIGPPKPGLAAHAGWWLIRLAQKAPYATVTHTEAIHELHGDGSVTMASSSVADHGVRRKRAVLTPQNWLITDVPAWDVRASVEFFDAAIAKREAYDFFGAAAAMLPGRQKTDRLFCTEAVLAPFVPASHYFAPAPGLAICLGHGRDVTTAFFTERGLCNA